MPAAPPALSAQGVWWRYGRGPWVLRNVALCVAPGELLRVRGGNGRGKSSLLQVLAGCVVPPRGRVRRSGPVAYLPQAPHDLPPVGSGRLWELLSGHGEPADPLVRADRGLRADRLSGGSARRLLLDAVLALDCAIAVLDEPAAGLDGDGRDRLAARLADRLAAGGSVVVAEHEPLPLDGGTVLDLGGGAVRPARIEVVLAGSGRLQGCTARDGLLTLTVPAAEADALLLEALRAGWSVVSVGAAR